jgi:hypothetical protein
MVLATTLATATGFSLSYAGLHDFALRSGLHGAEAWAWPWSVGRSIHPGRRVGADRIRAAPPAGPGGLAVPADRVHRIRHRQRAAHRPGRAVLDPVCGRGGASGRATLALAALLRQVYRRAVPDPVPAALNGTAERALELFGNQLAGGRVPSIRAIRSGLGVGQDRARSGTELPPHSDRRYTVTPIEVGLIVGVIVGLYVGFHGGHGHANYRHARARGGRPGLLVSLARGPYIRGSVPVGKGFRLTHKL